jgi:hypothetical protein
MDVLQVTTLHEMVILSLVGRHMRNMVGIAGRMFSTLAEGKVNIEMISQGASEINISCVIDGRDAIKALNIIHQSCLEVTRAVEPVQGAPCLSKMAQLLIPSQRDRGSSECNKIRYLRIGHCFQQASFPHQKRTFVALSLLSGVQPSCISTLSQFLLFS